MTPVTPTHFLGLFSCFFLLAGMRQVFSHPNTVFLNHAEDKIETPAVDGKQFEDAEFWRSTASQSLLEKLKDKPIVGEAKNVIFFLGDGWDIQTLTAARILKGQEVDKLPFGEEAKLFMESFPSTGFAKTYCVDSQVADSACTATAYLSGVKTNLGTIGVTPNVKRFNCSGQMIPENQVSSILAWAQAAGKSTGVVTTTKITDASPAGTYGHVANRDWECDADITKTGHDPQVCSDLASQLILNSPGKHIDVILGGGRRKFLPESAEDSEGFSGERKDGKNLIGKWKTSKEVKGEGKRKAVYVENASNLREVNASTTDTLLGLFAPEDLAYYHEQKENGDPTLGEMTEKAIEILRRNSKGFFLFVEGGRIDHAHHDNWGLRALWETIEFDRAIQIAATMTNATETLIVITADHGHTMTMAGYADRGAPIMGIAGTARDKLPYYTVNYANGPGYREYDNAQRYDISQDDRSNLTTRQVPAVPLDSETHGGHDVQILARGPFAHLFTGVHEQNYIPVAIAYAACIGSGRTFCQDSAAPVKSGLV